MSNPACTPRLVEWGSLPSPPGDLPDLEQLQAAFLCEDGFTGRDGAPLDQDRSVTVRAPRCVAADALTKVVMASGDANHSALARWQATAFII